MRGSTGAPVIVQGQGSRPRRESGVYTRVRRSWAGLYYRLREGGGVRWWGNLFYLTRPLEVLAYSPTRYRSPGTLTKGIDTNSTQDVKRHGVITYLHVSPYRDNSQAKLERTPTLYVCLRFRRGGPCARRPKWRLIGVKTLPEILKVK